MHDFYNNCTKAGHKATKELATKFIVPMDNRACKCMYLWSFAFLDVAALTMS